MHDAWFKLDSIYHSWKSSLNCVIHLVNWFVCWYSMIWEMVYFGHVYSGILVMTLTDFSTSIVGVHTMRLLHRHPLHHCLRCYLVTFHLHKWPYSSFETTGDGQMDGWTRPLIEITWFSPPIRLIWILLSVNSRYITYNFFSSNSMDQLRKKNISKVITWKVFFFLNWT